MRRNFWLVFAVCSALGCGASGPKPVDEQPQETLGRPPTPEDDPYFYAVRPPESARAGTTGTIGSRDEDEEDEQEARKRRESVDEAELRRELVEIEQKLADERARALQLEASNLELQSRLEEMEGGASSGSPKGVAQCYSCVKICPLDGDCDEDAEMVCGWGTGEKKSDARRRAKAECDGTLDRLRQTEFTSIEGGCPAAVCR